MVQILCKEKDKDDNLVCQVNKQMIQNSLRVADKFSLAVIRVRVMCCNHNK